MLITKYGMHSMSTTIILNPIMSQRLKYIFAWPVRESYTHALSKDPRYLTIDGQVCGLLYRWFCPMLPNHKSAFYELCGP